MEVYEAKNCAGRPVPDMLMAGLEAASAWAGTAERVLGGLLAGVLFALIVLNVTTRAAGLALIWVDEAAVYAMVWMIFVSASLCVRNRSGIAMTLLVDAAGRRSGRVLAVIVDLSVFLFSAALVIMCWLWFDLPGLVAANFDLAAFARETLNFTYTEPAISLGMRKFWFWLIMPVFSLSLTLHAARNLMQTLTGRAPDPEPRQGGGACR